MRPLNPEDPRSVGPYRLLSRLGAGGMGRVYLGLDSSGTAAAVKVVRSEFAYDPGFRARFARELDLARRVSGAFTPRVLAADASDPRPWLATEYVRGLSLRDLVDRTGPLPESTARFLARGIGRALAHMHESGLVHRDLTPGNVMVSASGPQVIDFGISHGPDTAGGTERTGDGEPTLALGTPGYMAPEQLDGGGAGPAADVFALAAVLVYVLSGSGPFGEGHPTFMAYRVRALEPSLTGVPEDLRPLVAACLAKDPCERPTTARVLDALGGPPEPAASAEAWLPPRAATEVADAERLYRDTVAAAPSAPSAPAGALRSGRRGRLLAVGAAGAALLLVAGVGAWAALDPFGDTPEQPSDSSGSSASSDTQDRSTAAGDGTAGASDAPPTSCDLTEDVAPEYTEAARDRLSVPGEETIGDDVYTVPSLSFSADGDALVVAHPEGVAVWDWREGTETAYIGADLPDLAATPVLSPDGCRVGYGSQGDGLHVFSVATGEYDVYARDLALSAVAFSPDGGTAAVAEGGGGSGVHTVDLATGEGTTMDEDARTDMLRFSPDGKRLLLSQDDSLVVVDPADGAELGRIGGVDFPGGALPAAWGDDEGDLVYFGSGGVLRTNVLTGADPRTLIPAEEPPETYYAAALRGGTDRLYTSQVAYDDEGHFVPELRVWEYSTGEELSPGTQETRFAQDFVVHPDGEVVAALAPDSGSVRILDSDDLSLLDELG